MPSAGQNHCRSIEFDKGLLLPQEIEFSNSHQYNYGAVADLLQAMDAQFRCNPGALQTNTFWSVIMTLNFESMMLLNENAHLSSRHTLYHEQQFWKDILSFTFHLIWFEVLNILPENGVSQK
jgi:hypothetical protein